MTEDHAMNTSESKPEADLSAYRYAAREVAAVAAAFRQQQSVSPDTALQVALALWQSTATSVRY